MSVTELYDELGPRSQIRWARIHPFRLALASGVGDIGARRVHSYLGSITCRLVFEMIVLEMYSSGMWLREPMPLKMAIPIRLACRSRSPKQPMLLEWILAFQAWRD